MNRKLIFKIFFILFLTTIIPLNTYAKKTQTNTEKIFNMIENKTESFEKIKKALLKNQNLYMAKRGREQENLLMVALKNDREYKIIKLLLDVGINPLERNLKNQTSVMYACQFSTNVKNVEIVVCHSTLLNYTKKRRILAKDNDKLNAFDYVLLNNNEKAKEDIISYLSTFIKTKKSSEPSDNENKIVEQKSLSENKIKEEKTPIPILPIEIEDFSVNYITEDVFIDVNKQDENGRTTLMEASINGNLELIDDLIFAGAILDVCDKDGNTALMLAAKYQKNPDVIKLLLDNNANFRKRNDENLTALTIAIKYNKEEKIIKALIENLSNNEKEIKEAFIKAICLESSKNILTIFADKNISLDLVFEDKTALMYAAETNSNTEIIEWLLKNGASKTFESKDGRTVWDFAKNNEKLPHNEVYDSLFVK